MGILTATLRALTWWNGQTLNTQFTPGARVAGWARMRAGNIFYQNRDSRAAG